MSTGIIGRTLLAWAMLPALLVMAGPLADDQTAELRGTARFAAGTGDSSLLVDVDYAVYPCGAYPDDGITGEDPSHGHEYVYAFQLLNISPKRTLTLTTLGMDLNVCGGVHNLQVDPLHALSGGVEPSDLIVDFSLPPNVQVDFWDSLPPGDHSSVFLFTSQNPPTMTRATLIDGGLNGGQQTLPTPLTAPHIPADFDSDCDVDASDYTHFAGCSLGPAILQTDPQCLDADLDDDGDVDHADFGLFQRCFSGPDSPVDQACLWP